MRRLAVLAASLCALALPSASWAADWPLPPGDSGTDEYTENIPGGGGDRPSDQAGSGNGSGTGTGSTLPPGVAQALEAQGAAGTAAADFAQTSGPQGASSGSGNGAAGEAGAGGSAAAAADDGGGSPLGDALRQIAQGAPDSSGMGLALPVILAATLLIAFLLALSRRRGRGHTPA